MNLKYNKLANDPNLSRMCVKDIVSDRAWLLVDISSVSLAENN
jgi:hypothetical protein